MKVRLMIALIALCVGAVAATAVPALATGRADDTRTVDVVGVRTGELLLGPADGPPGPGASLLIAYDFYAPGEVEPGAEVGSAHIICTFGFGPPVCNAVHVIDGAGEIHLQSLNTGPPAIGAAVIGGTGTFSDSRGDATVELTGRDDDPGETIAVTHRLISGRGRQ